MAADKELSGDIILYDKLTLEMIEEALNGCSEEDLKPYMDLGNGLYELPGYVIIDKVRLKEYLKGLEK